MTQTYPGILGLYVDKKYEQRMIKLYTEHIRYAQINIYTNDLIYDPNHNYTSGIQIIDKTIGDCNGIECFDKMIECRSMQQTVDGYKSKGENDNKYNLKFVDNSKITGRGIVFDCRIEMNTILPDERSK
jgi:hypothetical protein